MGRSFSINHSNFSISLSRDTISGCYETIRVADPSLPPRPRCAFLTVVRSSDQALQHCAQLHHIHSPGNTQGSLRKLVLRRPQSHRRAITLLGFRGSIIPDLHRQQMRDSVVPQLPFPNTASTGKTPGSHSHLAVALLSIPTHRPQGSLPRSLELPEWCGALLPARRPY
jgi:hypothetical protein